MKNLSVLLLMTVIFSAFSSISTEAQAVSMCLCFQGEDQPRNGIWQQHLDNSGEAYCQMCTDYDCARSRKNEECKNLTGICTVQYLRTPEDRAEFLLRLKIDAAGSLFVNFRDEPFDSISACQEMIKEKKYITYNNEGTKKRWGNYPAIWVMDLKGNLYVVPKQFPGKFNHSSIMAGGDVLCAGEIIVKNGKITHINNRSGHYRPGSGDLRMALKMLRDAGYLEPLTAEQVTEDGMQPLSEYGVYQK